MLYVLSLPDHDTLWQAGKRAVIETASVRASFLFMDIPYSNERLSTHSQTVSSKAPERNHSPVSHSPVPAASSSSSPLSPSPEEDEVQKGITIFPVKSLSAMNLSTGHAAMPRQIGYSSVRQELKKSSGLDFPFPDLPYFLSEILY